MKKITLLGFIFICFLSSNAQTPLIDWQRTIGGNQNETPYKIKQTTDGGYIIGGSSSSGISGNKSQPTIGNFDYWVVKLNADTTIQWEKTISGNLLDDLNTIIENEDGSFLIGGSSNSNMGYDKTENTRGNLDYWIIKLDADGTIIWDKTFGGSSNDKLTDIQKTNDNGFIIAGHSSSSISGEKSENSRGGEDYWVIKLNYSGEIMWQKTIGGDDYDFLRSIKQNNDGSYILAGLSFSDISADRTINKTNQQDAWIVKLSSTGSILWQENFNVEDVSKIIITTDGNFVLAGSKPNNIIPLRVNQSFQEKSLVIKFNPNGEVIWSHYNQPIYADSYATDIVEAIDGYYYTTNGQYFSNSASVSKLDLNGNLVWDKSFNAQNDAFIYSLDKTIDNSVICAIKSSSNIYGDKSEDSLGLTDYWVVKLNPSNLTTAENEKRKFVVYPNPFQNTFTINSDAIDGYDFSIYNVLGQEILKQFASNGLEHNVEFYFSSGIYFLKINGNQTKTFILKKI